ncbi:MAG: LTA synthase family protein [Muribaculaceae bacterium]|nr:LTA synthase family protein [Muribaculaceae bacterium]
MKPSLRLPYYPATLLQLFIPLLLLWLTRFGFAWYNADTLGDISFSRLMLLSAAGIKFDLCAWAWFNSPFILMRFLPFRFAGNKAYQTVSNVIFLICNTLMIIPALADVAFFRFNGTHLRWQALTAIWSDPEMGRIILSFAKDYWWCFLFAILLILLLALIAFGIKPKSIPFPGLSFQKALSLRIAVFIAAAGCTFLCIRGHVGPGRPLSIGDAVWGTSEASQMNVVLNTPFCILRSLKNDNRIEEMLFFSETELKELRSSLHKAFPEARLNRKNIMVITIESGSAIWVDTLNPVKGDTVRRLMPFLDSIAAESVVFPHAFTTGVRSIEGITSIFTGVPTFGDMILMTSPYYANSIDAPASLLKDEGYSTRFYFGGNRGSFNIDQTLNVAGFDKVVTREDYGLDRDFDGQWGVWDHKMAEYAVEDISKLKQPFFAGWFTLNPHGPYGVPSDWETGPYRAADDMRRTVEYEDRAIRHFFRLAEQQPWYRNTVFIIVGDHGFRDLKGTVYDSSFVLPHIAMMIYAPDGSLSPQRREGRFVTQFDLPPTILSLAGYPEDYIALGKDILGEEEESYALMFIKGAYQVCGPRYAIRLSPDLKQVEGVYEWSSDYGMKNPLSSYDTAEAERMARRARAFMQDYTVRLNRNRLSVKSIQ